jgi:hypothetical protein
VLDMTEFIAAVCWTIHAKITLRLGKSSVANRTPLSRDR